MIRISIHDSRLRSAAVATVGLAMLLAGCATTTQSDPTIAMKAAEQAIATADQARVADAASPELSEAREKLTAAQSAANGKRPIEAERLAIESRVDAELASANSEAAKAKAVNDEMRRSNSTLAQELDRTSGAKQ
jgi:hypothetical protein